MYCTVRTAVLVGTYGDVPVRVIIIIWSIAVFSVCVAARTYCMLQCDPPGCWCCVLTVDYDVSLLVSAVLVLVVGMT